MIKVNVLYVEKYDSTLNNEKFDINKHLSFIPSVFMYNYGIILLKNIQTNLFYIIKNRYGEHGEWKSYKDAIYQLKFDIFNTKKRKLHRKVGPYTHELIQIEFIDAAEKKRKLMEMVRGFSNPIYIKSNGG